MTMDQTRTCLWISRMKWRESQRQLLSNMIRVRHISLFIWFDNYWTNYVVLSRYIFNTEMEKDDRVCTWQSSKFTQISQRKYWRNSSTAEQLDQVVDKGESIEVQYIRINESLLIIEMIKMNISLCFSRYLRISHRSNCPNNECAVWKNKFSLLC